MIDFDRQAWEAYPQYRWIFNKLDLSMRLGYECGPACVPIKNKGYYIVKPIYNLFGMGIGSKKVYLDPKIHAEQMIRHEYVDPGHFWCEYLEGSHYSIDFKRKDNKWVPFSTMIGTHKTDDDLVKFEAWEKVEVFNFELPDFIQEINVEYLNIESKGSKIFEVHLRTGNDQIWNLPMGSKIYPLWNEDDVRPELKFSPNQNDDPNYYFASGHLKSVRLGYYVELPK